MLYQSRRVQWMTFPLNSNYHLTSATSNSWSSSEEIQLKHYITRLAVLWVLWLPPDGWLQYQVVHLGWPICHKTQPPMENSCSPASTDKEQTESASSISHNMPSYCVLIFFHCFNNAFYILRSETFAILWQTHQLCIISVSSDAKTLTAEWRHVINAEL